LRAGLYSSYQLVGPRMSKPSENNPDIAKVDTIEHLRRGSRGGRVILDEEIAQQIATRYAKEIGVYRKFLFWRAGDAGVYRPERSLWLPQRRAVAFAQAYLCAQNLKKNGESEAALIKMPTGTGKTAVIAVLACVSPSIRKTLIITPRVALVRQMRFDLAYRFWMKLNAIYFDGVLHENLTADELEATKQRIGRGQLSPVRVLGSDQYEHIYAERDNDRQILVGTFNALHYVLGNAPPAHRSMYGRTVREAAGGLRTLGDDSDSLSEEIEAENIESFRELLKSVDLVIVDEGHYEPAYSWSQSIRAINKPTILFSATPYRNDYKYFNVNGNFVFNLSWQEAVDEALIRDVKLVPPVGTAARASDPRDAKSVRPRRPERYSEEKFVDDFRETLAGLPEGKKAVVHAATFESLKRLQRAFYAKCRTRSVLIHDAFHSGERECSDLSGLGRRARDTLAALRFRYVRQTEKVDACRAAKIWLHQYKLLEGIDDDAFVEIWLYDAFGSARQLVQQVGRAIRRPSLTDRHGRIAHVRGSGKSLEAYVGAPTVASQLRRRWSDYLAYETYAANRADIAFTAETQLLATVKRTAPAVQYIGGEFRGGHLLDEVPTMAAFLLPRRGVVCRVDGIEVHAPEAISSSYLDDLQLKSSEAMLLEERFDITPVSAPSAGRYDDVRLIQYLAWNNSPYLASHHVPEWRLGLMAIVRAGRYIFLLDTEGICVDTSRLGLLNPEPVELRRLFRDGDGAGVRTRIVETAATGLDISELGLRSISIRKHALDSGYFDLAEASQVPTTVRGIGHLARETVRRRLSLSRASVADATSKLIPVSDYVGWARDVADIMANKSIKPHRYFRRFARQVPPLDADKGVPRSILLDLWDILDMSDEARSERRWSKDAAEQLLQHDTCCDITVVSDHEHSPPRYVFKFGDFMLELKYQLKETVPPSARYVVVDPDNALNRYLSEADSTTGGRETNPDDLLFGRQLSASLTRYMNQEQSFRIVPSVDGVVYSHGHFYKPVVDDAVFSILEPCDLVDGVVSEKGDTRVKDPRRWADQTLFGRLFSWMRGGGRTASVSGGRSSFVGDLRACELLICDDRSAEIADFYGVNAAQRRVYIVHAKADNTTPSASARKLQEVVRQAQTSLAFAGSSRQSFALPEAWKKDWCVKMKDAKNHEIVQPRFLGKGHLAPHEAHQTLRDALSSPLFSKEIVVLTAGILSEAAARRAWQDRSQHDLQFVYYLAGVRSTFDRAGVRFRIISNP
jgi:hypothetical protein